MLWHFKPRLVRWCALQVTACTHIIASIHARLSRVTLCQATIDDLALQACICLDPALPVLPSDSGIPFACLPTGDVRMALCHVSGCSAWRTDVSPHSIPATAAGEAETLGSVSDFIKCQQAGECATSAPTGSSSDASTTSSNLSETAHQRAGGACSEAVCHPPPQPHDLASRATRLSSLGAGVALMGVGRARVAGCSVGGGWGHGVMLWGVGDARLAGCCVRGGGAAGGSALVVGAIRGGAGGCGTHLRGCVFGGGADGSGGDVWVVGSEGVR